MLRVNTILFPTDGSSCAAYAYRHAVYLADRLDATLHVLHVVEKRTNNLDDLSDVVQVREEDILDQLRLPVPDEAADVSEQRIKREKRTHRSAAGGILAYVDEHDVDLVVMGTHGRRGVRRLLMGSVAEEVVRLSSCPVFTVCGTRQETPHQEIRRILVPVDLSAHTDRLFAHAKEIAATYAAQIDLLHVIEDTSLPTAYGVGRVMSESPEIKARVQRLLERYADRARADDLAAAVHVTSGHPAQAILDFITRHSVDLVAVATHGRTGLERLLLGSVAEKVVRMADCPVFTVKSFGKSLVAAEALQALRP